MGSHKSLCLDILCLRETLTKPQRCSRFHHYWSYRKSSYFKFKRRQVALIRGERLIDRGRCPYSIFFQIVAWHEQPNNCVTIVQVIGPCGPWQTIYSLYQDMAIGKRLEEQILYMRDLCKCIWSRNYRLQLKRRKTGFLYCKDVNYWWLYKSKRLWET